MRKNCKNLERKACLDVRKRDDRILKMVEDKHEQEPKTQRENNSSRENHHRIGEYRLRGNTGRATHSDYLIIRLGGDSCRVFVLLKLLEKLRGNLLLAFDLHET